VKFLAQTRQQESHLEQFPPGEGPKYLSSEGHQKYQKLSSWLFVHQSSRGESNKTSIS
jgi:hypothetical protein